MTEVGIVLLILSGFGLGYWVDRYRRKSKSKPQYFEPKIKKLETELRELLGASDSGIERVIMDWVADPDNNKHLIGATASDASQRLKDARRYAGLDEGRLANSMIEVAERELDAMRVQLECLGPQK